MPPSMTKLINLTFFNFANTGLQPLLDSTFQKWLNGISKVTPTGIGSAADAGLIPSQTSLGQNYPNPFNPSTMIQFAIPDRSNVTLLVFNTLGQMVRELVNEDIDAGYHEVQSDASGLASGVYFYRLQAGNFVETRRLLILR
jgi:hypothetical protein